MAQANRLMKMDIEDITDDDIKTIVAEDIEVPKDSLKNKKIQIGFCA